MFEIKLNIKMVDTPTNGCVFTFGGSETSATQ